MASSTTATATAPPAKPFRFQGQRVHLTYKTHLAKDVYTDYMKDKVGAAEVHIAHENAHEDTPYEHSHVILEWTKAFQTRDVRRFDFTDIHPHIKPITSRQQLEHTYRYLTKEDTTCAYLLEKTTSAFSKRIWSCKSLAEALEHVEGPHEVLGTIAMYNAKPREEPPARLIEKMRPWQAMVMRDLAMPADDRHIMWVCDPKGGQGKSRLAAHIEDSNMGIVLTGSVSMRDCAHIIKKEIDAGTSLNVIVLDLSRSFADRDVYNLLECLKNGRLTAGKYDSSRLRWKPGHVLVLANFPPELGRFSADRILLMNLPLPEESSESDETDPASDPEGFVPPKRGHRHSESTKQLLSLLRGGLTLEAAPASRAE